MTTVDFLGEQFRVADRVGALPLMRFAKLAKTGLDTDRMEGLVAVYDLLGQVIHAEDWARFEQHADQHHAGGDELLELVAAALAAVADRPTGRLSDSSDGPRITEPSSTVASSSPATTGANVLSTLSPTPRMFKGL